MGLFDSIRRVVGGGESTTDDGGETPSGLVDTSTLDVAALRQHAEDVAGEVEQLDFSLDSLERFDSAIDAGYDEELATSEDPAVYAEDVVRFGCYLGEVLVRCYDGEWTRDPQWGVIIAGPDDSATVSVFEVARRSIETKSVFAAVTDRAAEEVGLDGDDVVADDAVEADDNPDEAHPTEADVSTEGDEPETEPTAAPTDTVAEDSSPTIDPDDWGDSESESAASGADTSPSDDAVTAAPESDTGDSAEDATPDDSVADETGLDDATQDDSTAGETGPDEAMPDEEPAISDVAESEYGFEFESVADEDETDTEPDEPAAATDAEATDVAADDAATDTDSSDTEGPAESDATADPLTDTDDSAAVRGDESGTESSTDPEDAAALVEEAEPDAEPEASEPSADSESLFDEAETTPAGTDEASDTEPDDDPTQGDGLRAEYASEAEAFVSFWDEHDLDYTPESLERLDDLVAAEWDDDRFDDAEFGSEETFDDRAFTSVSRELGSYFGEVLVRELDGEWTDETTNDSVVVTGPDGPLAIPVFRVAGTSLKERPVFARSYDSLLSDIES
jgi:hypothetical protein